jgi:tRNA/rRNA methyltransferase
MNAPPAPAIVLVRPQLGQNIGMAARAMANFALADLRLVAPRDGWPNPEAGPAAAGADSLLDSARVHERIDEAVADCVTVLATTVRPRDSRLPILTPRAAAALVHNKAAGGGRTAILFGPERSGLTADDIAGAQAIVTCPVNPEFGSLNLAQAVLLLAYEWFQATSETPPEVAATMPGAEPASQREISGLIDHLERALESAGYFHPPARAPAMRRTLAGVFARAPLSAQDVRTLRGVVATLENPRPR